MKFDFGKCLLVAGALNILTSMAIIIIHELPKMPQATFYEMVADQIVLSMVLYAIWITIKIADKIIDSSKKEE